MAFRALNHPQSFNFTSYSALTRSKTWRELARENRLKDVRGLGPALQRKVLESLAIARAGQGRLRPNRAQEALDHSIADLRQYRPELKDLTVAGDVRRGCEVISDLSLVAYSREAKKPTSERLGALALHIAPPDQFAAALLYATGNQDHIARLESLAVGRGLSLTQAGLRKARAASRRAPSSTITKPWGSNSFRPNCAKGAMRSNSPAKTDFPNWLSSPISKVSYTSIRTPPMACTASPKWQRPRANAAISTSASPTTRNRRTTRGRSSRARDCRPARRNRRAQSALRQDLPHSQRHRTDIRADGSLDYPAEILARFDFIVASVHSQFRMDRVRQTERIVTAVSNPFTTILGHPTGRLLLRRPGYQVDIEPVLEACARHGVAVEINCNPNRLDLDWRWHRRALALGCRLSVNPDAHSIRELDLVRWGIAAARKGGVPAKSVLNAMPLSRLQAHLHKRRTGCQAR